MQGLTIDASGKAAAMREKMPALPPESGRGRWPRAQNKSRAGVAINAGPAESFEICVGGVLLEAVFRVRHQTGKGDRLAYAIEVRVLHGLDVFRRRDRIEPEGRVVAESQLEVVTTAGPFEAQLVFQDRDNPMIVPM